MKEGTVTNHICCDCGLVHMIHVGSYNKKTRTLTTYWFRDAFETSRLNEIERKKKKRRKS